MDQQKIDEIVSGGGYQSKWSMDLTQRGEAQPARSRQQGSRLRRDVEAVEMGGWTGVGHGPDV